MSEDPKKFRIGFMLYPMFDSLDVIGPYQVFTFLANDPIVVGDESYQGTELILIGPSESDITEELEGLRKQGAQVRSPRRPSNMTPREAARCGMVVSFEGVAVQMDCVYEDLSSGREPSLQAIFVPGSSNPEVPTMMGPRGENPFFEMLDRVTADPALRFVTSVCNGALLLATAGLLDNYRATTHWDYQTVLDSLFPNVKLESGYPRFVIDDNRVTGAGISSGLDEAFALAAIWAGDEAAKRIQLQIQYQPQPPFNEGDPSVAEPRVMREASRIFHPGIVATRERFKRFLG